MTVGELKEALEDYGDHLEVYVRVGWGLDSEAWYGSMEVTDSSVPDHDGVVIDV